MIVEVEHAIELSGFHVAGVVADAAEFPIVFDEPKDGGLVGGAVVNVILLRVGRDHEQRETRTVAATALCAAGGSCGGSAAIASASESIVRDGGLIDHWSEDVIVPAVGVVVGDDDRGVFPVLAVGDGVDHTDVEDLFVNGIGVAGMAVLISGGFEISDGREAAFTESQPESAEVVLVIGAIGRSADQRGVLGQIVMEILGAGVVLERLVVRNVVANGFDGVITGESRMVRAADRLTLGVEASGSEAALEPAPGDVLGIEEIADVGADDRRPLWWSGVADR